MTTTPKPDAGGHTAGLSGPLSLQEMRKAVLTVDAAGLLLPLNFRGGIIHVKDDTAKLSRAFVLGIEPHDKALAELFAASPDLLAALKSLRAIIHDDLTHAEQQHHAEAINFADLVIGKAGGGA